MTTIPSSPSSGPQLPPVENVDTDGLTTAQRFDLEIILRQVEACNDREQLKKLCHSTVKAWYVGKSNLANAMLQKLTSDKSDLVELMAQRVLSEEPVSDIDADGEWRVRVQDQPYDTFFQP